MKFLSTVVNAFSRYQSGRRTLGDARATVPADVASEIGASDIQTMIANARTAFANNGFVRDVVSANDIYSVGDGITPEPSTIDDDWNDAAEDYFNVWSRQILVGGKMTLGEATSLASQRLDIDGEFYTLKYNDESGVARLAFFEASRIDLEYDDKAANVKQGIRFDAFGKPLAYYFRENNARREVPAQNVIHTFVRESFSSIHGLPQVQHALASIADTSKILELVIQRAKLQNSIALKSKGDRNALNAGGLLPKIDRKTDKKEVQARAAAIANGTGGYLAAIFDGEELEPMATNAPGSDVLNALAILDRRSCGGVLPPDFFDPSKIGGASTRLITSKAARHFGRRQTLLINGFLNEIWRFVITNAMECGDLPFNKDFMSVEWNCPKSITVDAGREEATDMQLVACGLKSEKTYYTERGMNARKERQHAIADKATREKTKREFRLTDSPPPPTES